MPEDHFKNSPKKRKADDQGLSMFFYICVVYLLLFQLFLYSGNSSVVITKLRRLDVSTENRNFKSDYNNNDSSITRKIEDDVAVIKKEISGLATTHQFVNQLHQRSKYFYNFLILIE